MLNVDCTSCGSRFLVKLEHADQQILCPKCGAAMSVPPAEIEMLSDVTPVAVADVPLSGPRDKKTLFPVLVAALIGTAAAVVLMVGAWWFFLAPDESGPIAESSDQQSLPPGPPKKAPAPPDIRKKPPRVTSKTPPETEPAPVSLADLIERLDDGVVLIRTFDKYNRPAGLGSGFVIDASGLVATNYHVLEDARSAKVQMRDGTKIDVLGIRACDAERDLIIFELTEKPGNLEVLELAPEAKQRQGEEVIALGHPRGFQFTATNGIISAVRKTEELQQGLVNFLNSWPDTVWIQSTAAISGGNSGGPLLNREGKVIGVNTWVARGENLGFSVHAQHLAELRMHLNSKAVSLDKLDEFASEQRKVHRKRVASRLRSRLNESELANLDAAIRVIELGGALSVKASRRESSVKVPLRPVTVSSLPLEPFYLVSVDFHDSSEVKDLSFLNGLAELSRLHVRTPSFSDEHFSRLTDLPKLRILELPGLNITARTVANFKHCSNLEWLDLGKTMVGDQGVAELKSLPKLKRLKLNDTQITDAVGNTLREFPALTYVGLNNTKVGDQTVRELAQRGALTTLLLANTQITDESVKEFSKFKNLHYLNLSGTNISEDKYGVLSELPRLSTLSLDKLSLTDVGIQHLSRSKSLRQLSLLEVKLSKEQLQQLKKALGKCKIEHYVTPTLSPEMKETSRRSRIAAERIYKLGGYVRVRLVRKGSTTTESPSKVENLPKQPFQLINVFFKSGEFDVNDLSCLSGIDTIDAIFLPSGRSTDATVLTLSNLPNLKRLSAPGPEITDASLAHIRQFTSLVTLTLSSTSITDKGLAYLKPLRNLGGLTLKGASQITDAGLGELAGLPLSGIDLSETNITDQGLNELVRLRSLKQLELKQTKITDQGLAVIARCASLERLHLYETQMSGKGLAHLTKLPKLVMLTLGNSKLSEGDLAVLADMRQLKYVYLRNIKIGDAGLQHLGRLKGLSMLSLVLTGVPEDKAKGLKSLLPKCTIYWSPDLEKSPKRL